MSDSEIHTADAFMAIFGFERVKSCWDCQHNQTTGCALKRGEYETFTACNFWLYQPGSDQDERNRSEESQGNS